MSQLFYHSTELRCRVKPTGYRRQLELTLQKKWLIFWFNCFPWLHVEDRYTSGNVGPLPVVMKDSYRSGNNVESYIGKPLNLQVRVKELFAEYNEMLKEDQSFKDYIQSL